MSTNPTRADDTNSPRVEWSICRYIGKEMRNRKKLLAPESDFEVTRHSGTAQEQMTAFLAFKDDPNGVHFEYGPPGSSGIERMQP
jgi:hypothetical protein